MQGPRGGGDRNSIQQLFWPECPGVPCFPRGSNPSLPLISTLNVPITYWKETEKWHHQAQHHLIAATAGVTVVVVQPAVYSTSVHVVHPRLHLEQHPVFILVQLGLINQLKRLRRQLPIILKPRPLHRDWHLPIISGTLCRKTFVTGTPA